LLVTLDGQNVQGLAVDERNRSYIDLYAVEKVKKTYPVVEDATSRQRTLRLSVSELAHPDSVGHQCVIDAFQVERESEKALPVFSIALLAVGCVVVGWLLGHSMNQHRT
jgi:hypothetical protein